MRLSDATRLSVGGVDAVRAVLNGQVVWESAPAAGDAVVTWRTAGAVTDTSLTVTCKTPEATSTRVRLYSNATLAGTPQVSTAVAPGTYGESKHAFTGLTPARDYWYVVEADGADDPIVGRVTTAGAASWRVLAAGCALTGSSDPIFGVMATESARLMLHMGDAHYRDLTTTDAATWAAAYDGWLGNSEQSKLWSACAIDYDGSDHDTGPNNNDTGTTRGISRWAEFYRRYMPHHPIAATDGAGVYRTYLMDSSVRVIATDTRTYKSPRGNTDDASKTMLGSAQKAWFKQTLLDATEPVILWKQELPWNTVGPESGSDSWRGYHTERQEIADFIVANGLSDRLIMVFSDMHAVGWVSKADSNYGGFPIALVGPLDQTSPTDLSAMTVGPLPANGDSTTRWHQYGVLDFTRTAEAVTVGFSAKRVTTTNGTTATTTIIPVQSVTYPLDYTTPPVVTPTAFPTDVADLIGRFRGEELVAAGSAISVWPSARGGLEATQPTAARQAITRSVNGFKVAEFTGDVILLPSDVRAMTGGTSGLTASVVAMLPALGSGSRSLLFLSSGASGTSSRFVLQIRNSGNLFGLATRRLDSDGVLTTYGSAAPVAGRWFVLSAVADYANGQYRLYADGQLIASNTGTAGLSSNTASVGAAIGAQSDTAAEAFPGSMRDIILFNRALSDADLARVHEYALNRRDYLNGDI